MYSVGRRTKRWPLCLFLNFLDVVAINSAVIYKAVKQDGGMARKDFIKQLALQLMRDALNMRNQAKNLSRDLQVLIQKHAGTSSLEAQGHKPSHQMILNIFTISISSLARSLIHITNRSTTHSVSARTIRRSLQQSGLSARHPFLRLPLTQNHRRLRRQWCDERRMWTVEWNQIVFTDESRFCLQHHDDRTLVWRHRGERKQSNCVMHCLTGPAPGIMVWGGIGYHSRNPLVHITGILNNQRYISEVLEPIVLPYLQGLPTAIFQQDNARPHVARIVHWFFVNRQIELLPWLARSPDLSPIENMWSMVAQRLTQITSSAATTDQL
ncbi:hypothetical protein LAZ67_16001774 [Cordylochernes scorpioides]|uniref:Transposase n=1 Tax=Cordylochernes scorpioides TaxID=51811 RepID=A0ABY6LE56_9ARAC|nr:hypothetical protein LAZ67_16001774 [Cordylochernes scorpioides]